jgi:two-component system sensor histidine kinase/response regulator
MPTTIISDILSGWTDEFVTTLLRSKSFCVALFSAKKEMIYANNPMLSLFKGDPFESFINPTFENLLLSDNSVPLVFEGFLTLGDYSSINTSIWGQVYRKKDNLLILGGVNTETLLEQNKTMHGLNREINNIQRELLREKHSLEKTLNQLNLVNTELKKVNIDKDSFIAILSHDLKSPLNNLLGLSEALIEDIRSLDTAGIEDIANDIKKSAWNTYNLLEDILMWARTQSGKISFFPQKISLAVICKNILEILKSNADAKGITIGYDSQEDIIVFADGDMLKTVLRNLVSNAIKFTNKGGIIKISAERNSGYATISVSDNGIGIKPGNLSKLFDITEVITTRGTGDETGTGLGLLLCKGFVEKHGGTIWVESESGKGSAFKFTLPD